MPRLPRIHLDFLIKNVIDSFVGTYLHEFWLEKRYFMNSVVSVLLKLFPIEQQIKFVNVALIATFFRTFVIISSHNYLSFTAGTNIL